MNDSIAVCVLPVYEHLIAENAAISHFVQTEDLKKISRISTENIIDIVNQAGIQTVFTTVQSISGAEPELFNEDSGESIPAEDSYLSIIAHESRNFEKILLINDNCIGLTSQMCKRLNNMLGIEEDVAILLLNHSGGLAGIACKTFSAAFFYGCMQQMTLSDFYRNFAEDRFWSTTNGLINVCTVEDFRKLYREISERTNADFCKKEIYDRFTEIFIEYKELLK